MPSSPPLRVVTQGEYSNPYRDLLYTHLSEYGVRVCPYSRRLLVQDPPPSIWHIHWPTTNLRTPSPLQAIASSLRFLCALHLLRLRGTKTVWTVHNLRSHDADHPYLESILWALFVRSLDGIICMSPSVKQRALSQHPVLQNVPTAIIPHGHYREAYPNTASREEAREALALPSTAPIIAFVGRIRPYKNVPALIRAFRQLDDPEARLLIAGVPDPPALADELRTLAQSSDRIRLELKFIPDEDLQYYLKAADLVTLPYRRILNSGSALLGLSFDRPILVPHQGALPDLQQEIGEAWVHTYRNVLTPEVLRNALDWACHTPRPTRAPLDDFSWEKIARQTYDFYEHVMHS